MLRLPQPRKRSSRRTDRIVGVVVLLTIIIAWFLGATRGEQSIVPFLNQALPEARRFERVVGETFAAYRTNGNQELLIGYVSVGEAYGYGGPLKAAVAVNSEGAVIGISIIDHKEVSSYFQRVFRSGLLASLLGKYATDPFEPGKDIDIVSGATYTTRALAEAIRRGSHRIGKDELDLSVPAEPSPCIKFGFPEVTLILLFATGFLGRRPKFKYTKEVRWASMIIGLLILGFIYDSPLSLAKINALLLGFWPQWQTHLFWYLLIGGIIFPLILNKTNPYCHWFCPFGAAQECLGAIGGAKVRTVDRYHKFLRRSQGGLAWLAIVLALLFRNPGLSSYEIFGGLFDFTGSPFQLILLVIILIASLFILRPWCNYLCPIRPVTDYVKTIRNLVSEKWLMIRQRPIV